MNTGMDQQQQPKQQQIEWRRARVLELSSQGRTEREIAAILQIGKTTVDRDLVYLRKQAQENLKLHIQERLPEQYQKCMIGLNQVLKMGWDIVHNDSSTAANRLQALALINDSYKYVMDLTTNGVVITDAIKFVQTNKDKLAISTKEDDKESKESDYDEDKDQLEEKQEEETGEQETTNQVF
jgi:hypothetical protein